MADDKRSAGAPKPGEARSPIRPWSEVAAADSRPLPEFLAQEHYRYLGSEPLSAARYTDPAFFELEKRKLWPNVWQFAAREEDLPDVNDYVVYNNLGKSFLIVRQPDGGVRAFYNVCRHRGRQLRAESGNATEFRCPYHGWSFTPGGAIKDIPCRWDFPTVSDEAAALVDVSCERWGGYIFIREARQGPSLLEFLSPLPDFFTRWSHADCHTVVNLAKLVPANWKATAEAFIESYHAPTTHPQITGFVGDVNALLSIWGEHVNLNMSPFATPSPLIDVAGKSEQWIVDEYVRFNGRDSSVGCTVPPGETARRALAEATRERYLAATGYDVSDVSDAEMLDSLVFNVFPNFSPWGGHQPNIVYRWRPWPDQRHTLMEVRILVRTPKGTKPPRSVPLKWLAEDQPWSSAPELGALGRIFDQDMANLKYVQLGLESSPDDRVQLGDYQEIRIRHFHQTLDRYLGL